MLGDGLAEAGQLRGHAILAGLQRREDVDSRIVGNGRLGDAGFDVDGGNGLFGDGRSRGIRDGSVNGSVGSLRGNDGAEISSASAVEHNKRFENILTP